MALLCKWIITGALGTFFFFKATVDFDNSVASIFY